MDLSLIEKYILFNIHKNESTLSKEIGIDRSTITRRKKKLKEKGYKLFDYMRFVKENPCVESLVLLATKYPDKHIGMMAKNKLEDIFIKN